MENLNENQVDILLKKRKDKKKLQRRQQRKKRFNTFLKVLIFSGLVFLYLSSASSKPKVINVKSGPLLSRQEVLTYADISSEDYLLVANPLLIKNRLKKHPLIEKVEVDWSLINRFIAIRIEELEVFAYRYIDSKPYLIMSDGTSQPFLEDVYHILPHLVFIENFEDEELQEKLVKSFDEVDHSVISQMSEIHQHEVSYDDKMLRIVMNDGNQVFTSLQSVSSLNYYFDILKSQKINNSCIFIDEMTGKAFSQECPE